MKFFVLHTDTFDEFSLAEIKDELEEILTYPENTLEHLQHENFGPRFFKAYHKLVSEESNSDGYNT